MWIRNIFYRAGNSHKEILKCTQLAILTAWNIIKKWKLRGTQGELWKTKKNLRQSHSETSQEVKAKPHSKGTAERFSCSTARHHLHKHGLHGKVIRREPNLQCHQKRCWLKWVQQVQSLKRCEVSTLVWWCYEQRRHVWRKKEKHEENMHLGLDLLCYGAVCQGQPADCSFPTCSAHRTYQDAPLIQ